MSTVAVNGLPVAGPALNQARVPLIGSWGLEGGVGITTEPPCANAAGVDALASVTSSRSVWSSWKVTAFPPPSGVSVTTDGSSNFVPSHGATLTIVTPDGAASSVTVRYPWKSTTSPVDDDPGSPCAARTWAPPESVAAGGIDAVITAVALSTAGGV